VAASQCCWSQSLNGEMPVGGCPGRRHGDGGIQLQPDSGSIRVAAVFDGDRSKLCDSHIHITDSPILVLVLS
jgi:hypothetical protein